MKRKIVVLALLAGLFVSFTSGCIIREDHFYHERDHDRDRHHDREYREYREYRGN
jgi:hypothetical protein